MGFKLMFCSEEVGVVVARIPPGITFARYVDTNSENELAFAGISRVFLVYVGGELVVGMPDTCDVEC